MSHVHGECVCIDRVLVEVDAAGNPVPDGVHICVWEMVMHMVIALAILSPSVKSKLYIYTWLLLSTPPLHFFLRKYVY